MGYSCFGQIVLFRGPEHMDYAYALVRVLLKGHNMLYGEVGLGICSCIKERCHGQVVRVAWLWCRKSL